VGWVDGSTSVIGLFSLRAIFVWPFALLPGRGGVGKRSIGAATTLADYIRR